MSNKAIGIFICHRKTRSSQLSAVLAPRRFQRLQRTSCKINCKTSNLFWTQILYPYFKNYLYLADRERELLILNKNKSAVEERRQLDGFNNIITLTMFGPYSQPRSLHQLASRKFFKLICDACVLDGNNGTWTSLVKVPCLSHNIKLSWKRDAGQMQ